MTEKQKTHEDILWEALAKERDTEDALFMIHDEVWTHASLDIGNSLKFDDRVKLGN